MKKIFDSSNFKYLKSWRRIRIPKKNFIYLISAVVGVCAGIAAVILKDAVELIQHYLSAESYEQNYYQFAYPIIGLLITVLIAKYFYKETLGHAITDILYSISRRSSRMHKSKMYSRLFTSPFTVGFGGSAGLESPIVLTGAAIGSNIAQFTRLNYKNRTMMIGCGTAGVISAIFNAPVTGFIFSIEIIMGQVSINNMIPLLIASVSATLTSQAFLGDDVAFRFTLSEGFRAWDMIFYIFLGIVCGLFSLFFNNFLLRTEHFFERFRNIYFKAILGGIALSTLIFITPPIFGEGYVIMKDILAGDEGSLLERSLLFNKLSNEWLILTYIVLVVFVKAVAAAITIASGGSGGTFAPSLFLGALLGFAFARLVNLAGFADVSEANFALVGMCGMLAGAQFAPLTAIFLIAELTASYALFLPLMTVSALSLGAVSFYEKHSIYIRDLISRGHQLDQSLTLKHLSINQLIETDLEKVSPQALLKDLVTLITESPRNIFPVVDDNGRLMGIITLDDVRRIMFDQEQQEKVKIKSLMGQPPTFARQGESLESVIEKFDRTGARSLPVMHDGRYAGILSKDRVLAYYRQKLIEQSMDED